MSKKKIVCGAALLILATSLATGLGLYYYWGLANFKVANVQRFFYTLQFIERQFVDDADETRLVDGAIAGMMDALGDPHSVYLDAAMYQELMKHTEGAFGGIGVVMGVKDKEITVVAPIEGTPGAAAGIQAGDVITRIDGEDAKALTLEQAATRIRGDIGTTVVLTIRRAEAAERDYEITRSSIEIKTVGGTALEDGVGYIRISAFNEHTGKELEKVYRELEAAGARGFVLDLRNNPGGLLSASVDVGNFFVPQGPIVSTVRRDGSREVFHSKLERVKYPLAVLINGGSASASEIVAGAIQDTQAGTLVGTKSYGKGSVQVVMPMIGGDALKLTIARYYTPNNRCIDGVGIEPDAVVEPGGDGDRQLEKALAIVREQLPRSGGK